MFLWKSEINNSFLSRVYQYKIKKKRMELNFQSYGASSSRFPQNEMYFVLLAFNDWYAHAFFMNQRRKCFTAVEARGWMK